MSVEIMSVEVRLESDDYPDVYVTKQRGDGDILLRQGGRGPSSIAMTAQQAYNVAVAINMALGENL